MNKFSLPIIGCVVENISCLWFLLYHPTMNYFYQRKFRSYSICYVTVLFADIVMFIWFQWCQVNIVICLFSPLKFSIWNKERKYCMPTYFTTKSFSDPYLENVEYKRVLTPRSTIDSFCVLESQVLLPRSVHGMF